MFVGAKRTETFPQDGLTQACPDPVLEAAAAGAEETVADGYISGIDAWRQLGTA